MKTIKTATKLNLDGITVNDKPLSKMMNKIADDSKSIEIKTMIDEETLHRHIKHSKQKPKYIDQQIPPTSPTTIDIEKYMVEKYQPLINDGIRIGMEHFIKIPYITPLEKTLITLICHDGPISAMDLGVIINKHCPDFKITYAFTLVKKILETSIGSKYCSTIKKQRRNPTTDKVRKVIMYEMSPIFALLFYEDAITISKIFRSKNFETCQECHKLAHWEIINQYICSNKTDDNVVRIPSPDNEKIKTKRLSPKTIPIDINININFTIPEAILDKLKTILKKG